MITSANDLLDAVATYNGDPFLVETEELAEELFNDINSHNGYTLDPTDGEEFDTWLNILDLEKANNVKCIYVMSDNYGAYVLSKDYDLI